MGKAARDSGERRLTQHSPALSCLQANGDSDQDSRGMLGPRYCSGAECHTTSWDIWAYAGGKPDAVTTLANVCSYGYDANGNMVTRTIGNDTDLLSYDVENRLKEVKKNGVVTATFGYDGDGKMVTATLGVTTTYYVGHYFEEVGAITHTYYYHAGKRIAMREGTALYWLLTDHLGSTSMIISATQPVTGELRYREASPKQSGGDKAYGEARYSWGITSTTEYHFTGQREEGTIGLYFYNARWYDAALGRFVQADTVVPEPGNPQALNRYSYVNNDPLRYTDPSGYDPLDAAWEAAFRAAHGGRDPTDQDRRDRLFSLIFLGSGSNSAWTEHDWARYTGDKSAFWAGGNPWPGELAPGLERFALHVERLASYYKPNEKGQFVAAFAFVWAGVPLGHPIESVSHFAARARATATWEAYPPLHEGTADWRPELTDPDRNPSHHYAGLFYIGYFFSNVPATFVNWVRDGPLTGPANAPDLRLGNIAARHGDMLWCGRFSIYALGDVIRYSLSIKAYLWPADYPY